MQLSFPPFGPDCLALSPFSLGHMNLNLGSEAFRTGENKVVLGD